MEHLSMEYVLVSLWSMLVRPPVNQSQYGFYNTLAYSHVVISFAYLAVMLWQFLAQKGTPEHVRRGMVLKWTALLTIGGGAKLLSQTSVVMWV